MSAPVPPILEAGAGMSSLCVTTVKEPLSFELEFVRAGARRASGLMESRAEVILPTTLWLGAVQVEGLWAVGDPHGGQGKLAREWGSGVKFEQMQPWREGSEETTLIQGAGVRGQCPILSVPPTPSVLSSEHVLEVPQRPPAARSSPFYCLSGPPFIKPPVPKSCLQLCSGDMNQDPPPSSRFTAASLTRGGSLSVIGAALDLAATRPPPTRCQEQPRPIRDARKCLQTLPNAPEGKTPVPENRCLRSRARGLTRGRGGPGRPGLR